MHAPVSTVLIVEPAPASRDRASLTVPVARRRLRAAGARPPDRGAVPRSRRVRAAHHHQPQRHDDVQPVTRGCRATGRGSADAGEGGFSLRPADAAHGAAVRLAPLDRRPGRIRPSWLDVRPGEASGLDLVPIPTNRTGQIERVMPSVSHRIRPVTVLVPSTPRDAAGRTVAGCRALTNVVLTSNS